MRFLFILVLSFLIPPSTFSQDQPPASDGQERLESFEKRKMLEERSLVNAIEFESIGPTVFSGRVVDIDVHPEDPSIFYVAYASGGLWKTENNGMSFKPIFDNEVVMTLGDIAVNWENNIIWVGTGENNSSRSSYAGVGMYKSMDEGKTWEYKGLPESHHIGRIILDPQDPNTAIVGVLGHLYSPNPERGVYKTTDGGDSWTQTLSVNDNSGAIELISDPNDSNILYVGMWERTRRAWNFVESGVGTGIYKSSDNGDTWTKISGGESGFPDGEGAGRIGLDTYNDNGKTILYAILDNYFRRAAEDKEETDVLTKDDLRDMSKDDFLKLDEKKIKTYLESNRFPRKYSVKKVRAMVRKGEIMPLALVEYIEDANSLLFDTPVIGAEVYRSEDGGMTWTKTHDDYLEFVYNSYGYYFGQIRTSPHKKGKLYIMGVPILISEDDGKNWKSINGDNVHVDHHALWVNPDRDKHIILGNDGGINISYDDGEQWIKCNTPPLGQFYDIEIDNAKNYNVYGGLQDNGVWMGPNTYRSGTRWHSTGQYPYKGIMGGDGMQVQVDTRDNVTVYTGFQFGNYSRINTRTNERKRITPVHELGENPLRWNWQTPIHLSIHNQDILYMGSQYLHRSFDKGSNFDKISEDLTKGGQKGDVAFGTLTAIHESPMKFGLIYVGTDDGNVHVTRDGGFSWQN
ncbi:MAG: glycosyl hydrolase, partial [Bacteroidia bacterium]|nr:glycosyl hydrolase [Bacteroidia bacterium]